MSVICGTYLRVSRNKSYFEFKYFFFEEFQFLSNFESSVKLSFDRILDLNFSKIVFRLTLVEFLGKLLACVNNYQLFMEWPFLLAIFFMPLVWFPSSYLPKSIATLSRFISLLEINLYTLQTNILIFVFHHSLFWPFSDVSCTLITYQGLRTKSFRVVGLFFPMVSSYYILPFNSGLTVQ